MPKYLLVGGPLLVGTILAFSSLGAPIRQYPFGCQVDHGTMGVFLGIVTIPIYASTQLILIFLGLTLWKAPSQNRTTTPKNTPTRNGQSPLQYRSQHPRRMSGAYVKDKLEGEAVWQAIWFVVAYLLTWPVWGVAVFYDPVESHGFWILVTLLAPLTGTSNCLVYFWPRLVEIRRRRRRRRGVALGGNVSLRNVNLRGSGLEAEEEDTTETIWRKLRAFQWRIVKASKRVVRNAGGWIGSRTNRLPPQQEPRQLPQETDKKQKEDEDLWVLDVDEYGFQDITGLLRPVV